MWSYVILAVFFVSGWPQRPNQIPEFQIQLHVCFALFLNLVGCLQNLFNEMLEFSLSAPIRAVHDMEITLRCAAAAVALARIEWEFSTVTCADDVVTSSSKEGRTLAYKMSLTCLSCLYACSAPSLLPAIAHSRVELGKRYFFFRQLGL